MHDSNSSEFFVKDFVSLPLLRWCFDLIAPQDNDDKMDVELAQEYHRN